MTTGPYRLEWKYLKELPEVAGLPYGNEQAHCDFLIRFLDVPPGEGHCAFLCINVVVSATAAALGIGPHGRRAYLVAEAMTQAEFRSRVTEDVTRAFDQFPRPAALAHLDKMYVWRNQDHRDEFRGEGPPAEALRAVIEDAFAGVTRDDGITLHEALAIDDYASEEVIAAARARDQDTDWHFVPRDVLSARCEFFSYLDPAGFRYYLPAAMLLSVDPAERDPSDTPQRTYWSLLPRTGGPRNFGKGLGRAFDSEAFIARHQFNDAQVIAIYRFLCFMADEGNEGVDEEQLFGMRAWRESARRRTRSA